MKTTLLVILYGLFFTMVSSGQPRIYFPKYDLSTESETQVIQFLKENYKVLSHDEMRVHLTYYKKAVASAHYTFTVNYLNFPMLNSAVKVSTNGRGRVMVVSFESDALEHVNLAKANLASTEWNQLDLNEWIKQHIVLQHDMKHQQLTWDFQGGQSRMLLEVKTYDTDQDQSFYYTSQGELVYYYNYARYANKKDTLITARVFRPDPLTRLGLTYGGTIVDNGDAEQPWIAPAYDTVKILATWDSNAGKFLLENKWAVIDEFQSPIVNPVTSTDTNFFYNRSESGFEDCNALYHITNFQEYINSIGYDTLMDMQLQVETHGQFGADNSVFERNGGIPTIKFGTGGVDDAEDADVIIHEYSHGISWSANNNDNFTIERSGLDEGLADYFATSYSRVMNPFNWQNVFNWDGPIWGGRIANTSTNYPTTGNIYAVGEIWNSAMSNIWNDLGPIVTDKLMLESLHFFTNSTTLPEAAQYMLLADTLLFGGIHYYQLCANFSLKGILQGGCAPASVKNTNEVQSVLVHQSMEFARNEADLLLTFPISTSGSLELYGLDGKKVKQMTWSNSSRVVLSRFDIAAGTYLLKLKTSDEVFQTKIVKWAH
jgi:hypothetical protein